MNNLPFTATEETVLAKFAKFGIVVSVKLNRNALTGVSDRCGFVEMRTDAEAQNALRWLNFASYDGRVLSVIRAVAAVSPRVVMP
ncbi:MAG TPA: RNA-binding protein [Gammaproteobacteria bacterium]|nr:RNA-binding protein [Gammaproteobacteria bacterium]